LSGVPADRRAGEEEGPAVASSDGERRGRAALSVVRLVDDLRGLVDDELGLAKGFMAHTRDAGERFLGVDRVVRFLTTLVHVLFRLRRINGFSFNVGSARLNGVRFRRFLRKRSAKASRHLAYAARTPRER